MVLLSLARWVDLGTHLLGHVMERTQCVKTGVAVTACEAAAQLGDLPAPPASLGIGLGEEPGAGPMGKAAEPLWYPDEPCQPRWLREADATTAASRGGEAGPGKERER